MQNNSPATPNAPPNLRLRPGVILAVLLVVVTYVLKPLVPAIGIYGTFAGLGAAVLILLWWLFFSRAKWAERLGALAVIAACGIATYFLLHPSIAGGAMGRMFPALLLPITVTPALVLWAFLTRRVGAPAVRWTTMVALIFASSAIWIAARTDGIMSEAGAQLHWRWTPTAEERLLAQGDDLPKAEPRTAAAAAPASAPVAPAETAAAPGAPAEVKPDPAPAPLATRWPGFRGSLRNGVVTEARISTDWASTAPTLLWKRAVGPGWSSFAVAGDLIFTQEQRGQHEVVSAYRLSTGAPVWRHQDAARFYESNAGPGPRSSPAVHDGRVYTMGATGIVNALDARTGARLWTRNAQDDTGAPRPGWGFAGSPVVVDDLVITAASGRLIAYDIRTGEPKWKQTTGGGGYSSPHVVTLAGVRQILLPNGGGITSVAPADGTILWSSKGVEGTSIVQPAVTEDGDVLVALADMMGGAGIRRVRVSSAGSSWSVEERWTTRGLKPYFSDYVIHKGHAYGFDGTILSCIDLATGERKWKGGRYGAGQMVLLPGQDLLFVTSEEGELALVKAAPDQHTELGRVPGIEGKTWNHPVIVGDVVLVRNAEQMAAFRLPASR